MAVSSCGMCRPFSVTAGQVSLFKEKVTWVDLFSLAFMHNCLTNFRIDLDGVEGLLRRFWCEDRIAVSSA